MARVVVTDDSGDRVLMDEQVQKVHLLDRHSSMQVIERLAWAVEDAENGRERASVSYSQRKRRLQPA
jgi:hypothetical protein